MSLPLQSLWRAGVLLGALLACGPGARAQDAPWLFSTPGAEGAGPSNPLVFLRPVGDAACAPVDASGAPLQVEGIEASPGAGRDWYLRLPESASVPVIETGTNHRLLWRADNTRLPCDPEGFEMIALGEGWSLRDADGNAVAAPEGQTLVILDLPAELRPISGPAAPPEDVRLEEELERAKAELVKNGKLDPAALEQALKSMLDDPALLNRVLERVLEADSGRAFLKDLDLELVSFDAAQGETGLGVRYGFDRSFAPADWTHTPDKANVTTGLEYTFHASGNLAFDAAVNPADFLDTSLSWNWFRNSGGVAPVGDQVRVGDRTLTREDWQAENLASLGSMAKENDPQALRSSPALRQLIDNLRPVLTTQWYWELGVDAALESNQRFTEKNYVLGAHAGLDIKAWNNDARLAQFNLFDHPAALLRLLTGYEEDFRPRGSALPTVVISLDHVSPEGDDPRAQLGETSDYWRSSLELAYRSPIARIENTEVLLGASWRRYDELSASSAIEAGDLDHYDRVVLTLAADNGIFLSYSSGKLPFDERPEDVFELGLRVNF